MQSPDYPLFIENYENMRNEMEKSFSVGGCF